MQLNHYIKYINKQTKKDKTMTNTETLETIEQKNDMVFKNNKSHTIGFRFSGYNKYYNAFQVADVVRYIRKNGYNQYKPQDIESIFAVNTTYYGVRIEINNSIHVGSKNTQKEFIDWCIGFNDGIRQNNSNYYWK